MLYKEIDLDGIQLCTLRSWTNKLEKLPREDVWACAPICEKALAVLTVLNDSYRSKKGNIHCSPRFSFEGALNSGDNINKQLKDATYNRQHLLNLMLLKDSIVIFAQNNVSRFVSMKWDQGNARKNINNA